MAAEHTVRMGERIREQREKAGLTQAELAALIPGKADGTQVSKWERGKNRPGDDTLEHIAKALNCKVADFHVDPPTAGAADLMAALSPEDLPARLDRIERGLARLDYMLIQLLGPEDPDALELELDEALRRAGKPSPNTGASARSPRRPGAKRR